MTIEKPINDLITYNFLEIRGKDSNKESLVLFYGNKIVGKLKHKKEDRSIVSATLLSESYKGYPEWVFVSEVVNDNDIQHKYKTEHFDWIKRG